MTPSSLRAAGTSRGRRTTEADRHAVEIRRIRRANRRRMRRMRLLSA